MAKPWAEVYRLLAGFNSFLAMWQVEAHMRTGDKYRAYVAMCAVAAQERYRDLNRDAIPPEERDRLKYAFDLLSLVLAKCGISITEGGWWMGSTVPPPPGDPEVMLLRALAGTAETLTLPPEPESERRLRYAYQQHQADVPIKDIVKAINKTEGWKQVEGESGVREMAKAYADAHGLVFVRRKRGRKSGGNSQ